MLDFTNFAIGATAGTVLGTILGISIHIAYINFCRRNGKPKVG